MYNQTVVVKLVAVVIQNCLDVLRKNEVVLSHNFHLYLLELCQFTKTGGTTRRSATAARRATTTPFGRTIKNAIAKRSPFNNVYFQWLTHFPNYCKIVIEFGQQMFFKYSPHQKVCNVNTMLIETKVKRFYK